MCQLNKDKTEGRKCLHKNREAEMKGEGLSIYYRDCISISLNTYVSSIFFVYETEYLNPLFIKLWYIN